MRKHKTAGLVGIIALTAVMLGAALPASAAPTVDPSGTGTLHITKAATPASAPGDGLQATVPDPIEGVVFTLEKIDAYDLTTMDGWKALAHDKAQGGATPASLLAADAERKPIELAPTDSNGMVSTSGLALGVYVVTETSTPEGVVPAAPFVVTLPMTHPLNGDEWLYEVFAYPKNDVVEITKAVDKATANIGDELTYTIVADVPSKSVDPEGKQVRVAKFVITDDYDETRLTMSDPTFNGSFTVEADGVALDNGDYVGTLDNGQFVLTFTEVGLDKLSSPAVNQVTLTLTAKVIASGDIDNTAILTTGLVDSEVVEVPSNEVGTQVGSIDITKTDATSRALLGGAVFELYAVDGATGGRGDLVVIDGASRWTTDGNGLAVIDGVAFGNYWLVEVVAPVGYELNTAPIAITVDDDPTTNHGDPATLVDTHAYGQANPVFIDVENVETRAGWDLPFTGGAGVVAFTVAGLIGAGVVAAVIVAAKRRQIAE